LICGHCGTQMYAYYRQAKTRPVKTLRCHRKLGGCGRLARGTEPIETFLEAALFEMVRRPAFAQFLTRRSAIPDERGKLLEQIRAVEALQQESLVAYAAPEPGARRRTKAEYELIAARLDDQLNLLNKKIRAVSAPELPDTSPTMTSKTSGPSSPSTRVDALWKRSLRALRCCQSARVAGSSTRRRCVLNGRSRQAGVRILLGELRQYTNTIR
jgi:hypothetical protein